MHMVSVKMILKYLFTAMQLLVKNADFVEFFFLFLLFEYTVLMFNSILTLLTIYLKVSNLKIAWLGAKNVHSTPSKLHYYAHHKAFYK